MMGTLVEVSITEPVDEFVADRAFSAAFDAIARVDRTMSFHRPDSDLCRLNAAAAGELITLDAATVDVLRLCLELTALSDGAFDCNVGGLLIEWGLLPGHAALMAERGDDAPFDIVDDRHVRLRRGVCLDLGGIAKGYAVDKAVEALTACGVKFAVVNAGGDLRVLGARPARIHVRCADGSGSVVELGQLSDGAIATSSVEVSGRWQQGVWRSALVNPLTGSAVRGQHSYSVCAESCAVADGLTKVLAIAGSLNHRCLERYAATPIVS